MAENNWTMQGRKTKNEKETKEVYFNMKDNCENSIIIWISGRI